MAKDKNVFQLRKFADFTKDDTWTKHLKPALLKMGRVKADSEAVATSGYRAIVNDVERVTTNKTINSIIRLVEGAENKLSKK